MSDTITQAQALSILRTAMNAVVENWTAQFERQGHAAPAWCVQARKALEDTKDVAYATPIEAMSDDDIWHVVVNAATKSGGSLFNLSKDECVTDVRASFMNPDAGREFRNRVAEALARRDRVAFFKTAHPGAEVRREDHTDGSYGWLLLENNVFSRSLNLFEAGLVDAAIAAGRHASTLPLYYVCATSPADGSNVDLVVRAADPEQAETFWREYFVDWDLPEKPKYIATIPLTGSAGAIGWDILEPETPGEEDDTTELPTAR